MASAGVGALIGLVGGLGILLGASWHRARRPLSLAERIGPYVGVAPVGSGRTVSWSALVAAAHSLSLVTGQRSGDRGLVRRLRQAGASGGPAQYRLERLVWCALGAGGGAAFGAILAGGGSSPVTPVVLGVVGGVGGWWAKDAALRRAIRSRQRSVELALPVLADLLALAVASGAAPVVALERSAQALSGPLADEVAAAGDDIRTGAPLGVALGGLADRIGLDSVRRFVDGIVVSLERGTPLADVLRAQAGDVRAAHARRLMESAGRKDVAMLVPIVFLVLPCVVLVALYPGISALRLVVP